MKKPSDPDGLSVSDLLGLGSQSARKSYYPELTARLVEAFAASGHGILLGVASFWEGDPAVLVMQLCRYDDFLCARTSGRLRDVASKYEGRVGIVWHDVLEQLLLQLQHALGVAKDRQEAVRILTSDAAGELGTVTRFAEPEALG